MKAMILVLSPKECVNLLNGDLSILVRKRFPKDYAGWVYIYCRDNATKDGWCMVSFRESQKHYYQPFSKDAGYSPLDNYIGNGKVVGRFWCDKVGEIHFVAASLRSKRVADWHCDEIFAFEEHACLTQEDLDKYLGSVAHYPQGKAIHVAEVKSFDKPKELVHHTHDNNSEFYIRKWDKKHECWRVGALTHAPRCGYCYVYGA